MAKYKYDPVWVDEKRPEILKVSITLEYKSIRDLGIDNMETPSFEAFQYIDVSKINIIRHSFPNEEEQPSKDTCIVDGDIVNVSLDEMLKLWQTHKKWKNEQR